MVRFGNFFKSVPALTFAVLSAGAVAAAEIPLLDGHVTAKQWQGLPENPALARCDSTPCAVLRSVVTSFVELNARDLPNSMARAEPKRATSAPISVVGRIRAAPTEADLACGMLSTLARSYFDWSIGLHTVEIASLIEPFWSGCVRQVVKAFPYSSETRSLLADAADSCEARKESGCRLIAESVAPSSGSSSPH